MEDILVNWRIKSFNDLTLDELYEICKVRYEVFACEQRIYQENEFDDIDKKVFHIFLVVGAAAIGGPLAAFCVVPIYSLLKVAYRNLKHKGFININYDKN